HALAEGAESLLQSVGDLRRKHVVDARRREARRIARARQARRKASFAEVDETLPRRDLRSPAGLPRCALDDALVRDARERTAVELRAADLDDDPRARERVVAFARAPSVRDDL